MSRPPLTSAAIIAVGSEMLTPTRLDTNSLFITDVLNGLGIDVACKAVVGDDRAELTAHLALALSRHDLVIVTGGLGPTDDDLTREVVAAHLNLPLDEDAEVLAAIERRFAWRGFRMPAVNRRQAQVPRGAEVLPNPNGTAPGLWLETGGRIIVLLPGPPREMKPMLRLIADERLAPRAGGLRIHRRLIRIAGRTESRVEELTQPIYSSWTARTPPIATTILSVPGLIELHLSARSGDAALGAAALDAAVAEIDAVLGPDIVSRDGRSLEEVVGDLLRGRGLRIALAESCTGGLATTRLTDVPGSSDYVERGVVVYSNAAKTDLLGVPADLIAEHGAVSEAVAARMAMAVRTRAGVDIGVGITGIAGPGGGSDDKPVGTVCIAVAAPDARARTFRFPGNRELVRTFSAVTALDMVRRRLEAREADGDWVMPPSGRRGGG